MASTASTAIANLTFLSLLLLLLLLLPTSSHVSATPTTTNITSDEDFIRCFLANTKHSNSIPQLFTPNTTSYNAIFRSSIRNLRQLSNSTRPSVIATPSADSHVRAAVVCARRHGLKIRVRSGGHDYEGFSYVSTIQSPFIILDLVNLRSVTVNPADGTAWVGAGATIGDVYYHIAVNNRTAGFPAGICTTVGVGGQFSGGGIGSLIRKYGVAADNIVDALLVDRRGNLRNRESMGEDLFWAIRGGGAASFGVIVSFKIKLVHVPPTVTVFNLPKTLEQNATHLVETWQHIAPNLPEDLFIRIMAMAVGSSNGSAKGNRTIRATFQGLFLGRSAELLRLMGERFSELGLESKHCMELSWVQSTLYFDGLSTDNSTSLLDRRQEPKASFKAKSDFVTKPISEKEWETIWEFLKGGEDEPVVMIMDPWGGRMGEIAEDAIAFPHRKGNLYNIQYFMRWTETEEAVTERHLGWMKKLYGFMTPYVSKNPRAAYLNYKDIDLGKEGEARVWGREYFKGNFERLGYVKLVEDPENYFGNEQSIPPFSKERSFYSHYY